MIETKWLADTVKDVLIIKSATFFTIPETRPNENDRGWKLVDDGSVEANDMKKLLEILNVGSTWWDHERILSSTKTEALQKVLTRQRAVVDKLQEELDKARDLEQKIISELI